MNKIKFLLVAFLLALSIDLAHADSYEACQQACAGNGLSCLNKCVAESNDTDNAEPQGNIPNGAVIEEGKVDTFERERAADRLEEEADQRVNHFGDGERPFRGRR